MSSKILIMLLTLITFYSCAQKNEKREQAMKLNDEAMSLSLGKDDSISLKKSIKLLDKAITIDSTYLLAYSNKVSILFQLKNYNEAIRTLNKMSDISEKNAFIYMMKGIAYKKIGYNEIADSNLMSAFKLSSDFDTNMDKSIYFNLLVYFKGKEVAIERINELYKKGELDENLYQNYSEVISSIDEADIFKEY